MRIPSGTTDRYIYFVAVDSADFSSRETGLSSFTVYRSRNGGAAAAMTTPTINETDSTNMPGVYELLLDEDTTIGAGNDSEEMCLHITHTGMAPVTRTIELYRPETTEGNTLDVTSTGAAGIDWANVENATSSVTLSGTTVGTVTTNSDMRGTDSAFLAANAPTNFSDLAITVTTGQVTVGTNNDKSGYSISGTLTTLDDLDTAQDAQHASTQTDIAALNDFNPGVDTVTLADGAHGGASATITLSDYSNFQGAAGSDRLLMVDTTIATLASQTSFTLTAGSADDDAYNGCTIVIEDASTSAQKAVGIVDDYTGSTKTVTLLEDPGVFTMATTDKVYILAEKGLKPTTAANYHVDVSSGGSVGVDWANVDGQSTSVTLSGTTVATVTNQVTADVTARWELVR